MKGKSMEELIQKEISDLGAGAYLLMHGYKVLGKKGRTYVFEVEKSAIKEFDIKVREYLTSEFHRFDSCLMSLKKIGEYMP